VVKDGVYAWIIVAILLAAYANAYVDRQLMNLLVSPVKTEFHITDTRVSLLIGFAFVVPLALLAPFAGRLADIWHRRTICILAIASWSLLTLLSGISHSYNTLFAMRMLTGACEAFLVPAAWSLLGDYFSKAPLPRAMSVFMLGPYIGSGLALVLGGVVMKLDQGALLSVGGIAPWRATFMVAGFLGIIPAFLFLFVDEPARPGPAAAEAGRVPQLRQVVALLRERRRFYGSFYGGMALLTIPFAAVPAWMPTLLARRFGVGLGEIGLQYGMLTLVAGCAGVLSGPIIGRLMAGRGYSDQHLQVALIACLVTTPTMVVLPMIATYRQALVVSTIVTFAGAAAIPMTAAALQIVTPHWMHGVTAALYLFVVSVVGVALPPVLVAILTDYVFRDAGMVGWSLSIVCSLSLVLATIAILKTITAYRACLEP